MSLLSLIRGRRGPSGFGYASTAEEVTAGLDPLRRPFFVDLHVRTTFSRR